MNRQQWLARAEEHEAKLAELMERDEDGSYAAYLQESAADWLDDQKDCPVMPTPDELRRAENGDPWAVLLVGILRAVSPNNGVQPTAELAGSESIAAESDDVRQPAAADA